jgi:hypothetical protein
MREDNAQYLTITEQEVVEFIAAARSHKKRREFIAACVKQYVEEWEDREDVLVKVSILPWDRSIDPMFIGQMCVILVRYRDDYDEVYAYRTHAIPDPWFFKGKNKDGLEFLDRHIRDMLNGGYLYQSAELYSLEHKEAPAQPTGSRALPLEPTPRRRLTMTRRNMDKKFKSPFVSAGVGAPAPSTGRHGALEAVGED